MVVSSGVVAAVAAGDQVADADLMLADAAGQGRGDPGEPEIELGRADRRFGGFDGGGGDPQFRDPLVIGAGRPKSFLRNSAERPSWRVASSTARLPWASCACAAASVASYGRGSITKSRSPFLTICPSWKWISVR